jgi:hypothetical protein
MDGELALERMIAKVRAAGQLGTDGLPDAAAEVQTELRASAAAGQSPDGKAWAPRKADGGRAMAGAAGKITVAAIGRAIWIRLTGPEVNHHFGVRGAEPRNVIPAGGLPAKLGNAVRLGFAAAWERITQ